MVSIRHETASDREAVFRVEAAAFGGDAEARLVDLLRGNGHGLLSLVAEDGGELVGHIMFSPMTIEGDGVSWGAVCLAPVAVAPSRQNEGIGGLLIQAGLAELREASHGAVVLLGHPAYYPRFGFRPAREFGLHYQDDRDAFMALELHHGALDGVSGKVKFSPSSTSSSRPLDYEGVIIEESLRDTAVLKRLTILSTRLEAVTDWHATPWLTQWTFHTVIVAEAEADEIAALIGGAIERKQAMSWYADYKNDTHHYVIFSDCAFYIDRRNADEYEEARAYGIGRGLPPHQADFVALIEE